MKALVTGGGGFLGTAICEQLIKKGWQVSSFSRNAYPHLEKLGVSQFQGNLTDSASLKTALSGKDIVFHVAAKTGIWGKREEYLKTNFEGTETIVSLCLELGIRNLVYSSTPSVIFNGKDMEGVDESVPYPEHFEAFYPETKAMAEKLVMSQDPAKLATVSLRPHLIWGPRDHNLVRRILERGKKGMLKKIGDGSNKVDVTYIDDAAKAHVLAAEKLSESEDQRLLVAGKTYFISSGQPIDLWEMVNRILAAGGLEPVKARVSLSTARFAGLMLENIYKLFNIQSEPRMTRWLADELSSAHWFDISAAKKDLGYEPEVSIDLGFERLSAWLSEEAVK